MFVPFLQICQLIDFKTTYKSDSQTFPIASDRYRFWAVLAFAYLVIPFMINDYWASAILLPFLIYSIAAIGLNILVGYCGQVSLGTGGFMAVGAYACYKLMTSFPDVSMLVHVLLSGLITAAVGVLFGLPSLRIKGFYLLVSTLAAQFFLEWCFIRVEWLYNYNDSGAIDSLQRSAFGYAVSGGAANSHAQYFVVLTIVVVMTWVASNLIRGRIGRSWMMIRDMDIAAELMGVRPLFAKLSAFAVSSFYCGVAGALMVFFWLGSAEVESFDINHSFLFLFMAIIGGLGSLIGCYMGAAFIWILPIIIRALPSALGLDINAATVEHINFMMIGAMIIFFLIVEPHGLARLWQIAKEKLRTWPFPYS